MDKADILEKIQELRVQHRDLDDAIAALISSGTTNMLQIKRLKKQKLMLKDRIAKLEDQLVPDIIA
ncbi:YdcH family protein [Pseudemcibacter aquimaris]|uniref:YdcH family protein n=1 Tax=Pseudemcibacter aquimaris TaxID=2857064 RepID=UPI003B83A1C6